MVRPMMRSRSEIMRDEMIVIDDIAAFVALEPRTIPEIAEHLGAPRHEVVVWTMDMWKYGILRYTGRADEDGYFRYELND
jgi:hypothetical protein